MPNDGVYADDPSEAVAYLRDKVLGKKLGGSGMELRPMSLPQGPKYLGLARTKAANRMDLNTIPRVAIGSPKKHEVPVWVIPTQGMTPDAVESALAQAQVHGPDGQTASATYRFAFPADTQPDQLVAFAQRAMLALGVAPGQGWQWIKRGRDQLPG